MANTVQKFLKNESGSTAIEYGLIASLIVVVIIGGMTAVGTATNTMYQEITDTVTDATN